MNKQILNKLKYLINKKKTVDEICENLNMSYAEVLEYSKYLSLLGFNCEEKDGHFIKTPGGIYVHTPVIGHSYTIEICLLSDAHYASEYDRVDVMKWIYDECERRGIDSIFCSGDLTDGFYPERPNYQKSQRVCGYDATLEYVLNVHPYSRYINFYTIAGNHDKSFKKSDNKNICEELAKKRNDIIYLGEDTADVRIGRMLLHIYHGYSRGQKTLLERIEDYYKKLNGNIPDMLQMGHIHHSFFDVINGTYAFQTAALTDQQSPTNKKNWGCEISCWFVKISFDEFGNVIEVIPELKTFEPNLTRKRKFN
ncbi:MAG: hypothetical protein E7167_02645 [Firmicutes bacterium]|nr:hypothetical protein [Bacillota bacterium]